MKEYKQNCCAKRSILEKILIVVLVLLVCLLITLFSVFIMYVRDGKQDKAFLFKTVTPSASQKTETVCSTRHCVKAAAQIMDIIDPTLDPCEDFYEFVCGTFLKRSKELNEITPLSKLEAITLNQLDSLITEPTTEPVPKAWELQRRYYKSCMDTKGIDEDANRLFLNLINKLGDWPVLHGRFWDERKFHWLSSIVNCRKLGFGFEHFMRVATVNLYNSTGSLLLSISPPVMVSLAPQFRQPYVDLMTNISIVLGAPSYLASNEFTRVFHFEEGLKALVQDEDEYGQEAVVSVAELAKQFPSIPWIEFLDNITVTSIPFTENSLVHFRAGRYLRNLQKLLSDTSKTTQANYVVWKIVENFRNYLNESVRTLYDSFLLNVNPDLVFTTNRYKYCLNNAKSYFPSVAELAYVKKYLPPPRRQDIKHMINKIKQQLMNKIKTNDWLDTTSKNLIINKLYEIDEYVGSSDTAYNQDFDEVVEMEGLDLESDNIVEMVTKLRVRRADNSFRVVNRKSEEVTQEVLEKSPVLHVNGFYAEAFKVLVLPAPFLQGVIYNFQRPQYMNYGALGSVVGHELTHGFMFDPDQTDGDIVWSQETAQKFQEKIQCVLDDYDNYTEHLSEFTKDANMALQENIADLVGPDVAYLAYQEWVRDHGQEPNLPGLNYTSNQIFWIMSGAFKCHQPKLRFSLRFDQHHGVPSFAVGFSKKNSAAFASDFNCPLGSEMNPEKKCQIL